jgi:hypothetical protein
MISLAVCAVDCQEAVLLDVIVFARGSFWMSGGLAMSRWLKGQGNAGGKVFGAAGGTCLLEWASGQARFQGAPQAAQEADLRCQMGLTASFWGVLWFI